MTIQSRQSANARIKAEVACEEELNAHQSAR